MLVRIFRAGADYLAHITGPGIFHATWSTHFQSIVQGSGPLAGLSTALALVPSYI